MLDPLMGELGAEVLPQICDLFLHSGNCETGLVPVMAPLMTPEINVFGRLNFRAYCRRNLGF